ncbi:hypothetical protein GCM10010191_46060 [Actinomadura vinacea]|uniref:Uncharacterized protein n=1 Tax=Actinomadura vinacea TaxID=115336 RepID=A0ABN3JEI6_9ACTN
MRHSVSTASYRLGARSVAWIKVWSRGTAENAAATSGDLPPSANSSRRYLKERYMADCAPDSVPSSSRSAANSAGVILLSRFQEAVSIRWTCTARRRRHKAGSSRSSSSRSRAQLTSVNNSLNNNSCVFPVT